MRLETLFHFSFYLTLALAAVCLALPTTFFLPWMPFFVLVMLGLLFVAWRCDGVWVLSEMAANHLGVFIAIGAAGWILFQIPRSEEELVTTGVNWPAGLLPHLGPLLMILLVVKLFRPKRLPDYWVIQTMGLMMVTLAAVLADDHTFGLFVMLYLASLVWSLALYYPVRERALAGVPLTGATPSANYVPLFGDAPPQTLLPWWGWGLPRAARWTCAIVLAGFAIFLVAPRQGQSQWNARQLTTVSGATFKSGADAGIDLNRTGTIELSDDPAFAVTIRDHLGQSQSAAVIGRWRTEALDLYAAGRWYPYVQTGPTMERRVVQTIILNTEPEPERINEGELLVTFQVKPKTAGGFVLAEPLDLGRGIGLAPRVNNEPQRMNVLAIVPGCDTFLPATTQSRKYTYTYSQVVRAPANDLYLPAPNLHRDYVAYLANQGAPRPLISWTRDLVQRLPGLRDEDRLLDRNGRVPASSQAKVALALRDHLLHSGEYTYTLELRRHTRDLDPTVDFLMNVKEGHCERYAGGLALMLRALGMRCRLVKGYVGGETDEDGQGIVRLSGAHSWVQALVPGESSEWQWLMLDPTPSTSAPQNALVSWWRWCQENLLDTRIFWRQFIMEYTPEQQGELLGGLLNSLASRRGLFVLLFLGAAATAIVLGPRMARRGLIALCGWWSRAATRSSSHVRFFDDLVRLARRHGGVSPQLGQTPREFAAELSALLQQRSETRSFHSIPGRIVSCYYQVRYGGSDLTASERREVETMVDVLRSALKQK